jgi:hypothetical protein
VYQRKETVRRKVMQAREKVGNMRKGRQVAKHCVIPMFWDSGRLKSRLAKAAGAEPSGEIGDEKLDAIVARRTCGSQNVKDTSCLEHCCKFRCRNSGEDTIQMKQKRAAKHQRNKHNQEQEHEQHLPIRRAGRPADSESATALHGLFNLCVFRPV